MEYYWHIYLIIKEKKKQNWIETEVISVEICGIGVIVEGNKNMIWKLNRAKKWRFVEEN